MHSPHSYSLTIAISSVATKYFVGDRVQFPSHKTSKSSIRHVARQPTLKVKIFLLSIDILTPIEPRICCSLKLRQNISSMICVCSCSAMNLKLASLPRKLSHILSSPPETIRTAIAFYLETTSSPPEQLEVCGSCILLETMDSTIAVSISLFCHHYDVEAIHV
jgi:hypothetical protein